MADVVRNAASAFSDATNAGRIGPLLSMEVDRIRGAIRANIRNRVSATAGTLPPEAKLHCYTLTVRAAIGSVPGLYSINDTKTEFGERCKIAEDWIKAVEEGCQVTQPSDPDTTTVRVSWGSETYLSLNVA